MHDLETALSSAAPQREARWHHDVLGALSILGDATRAEIENAARVDSLLSDFARTQPWLRNRVRGLRAQYRHLQESIDTLCKELGESNEAADFADIRHRLALVRHRSPVPAGPRVGSHLRGVLRGLPDRSRQG